MKKLFIILLSIFSLSIASVQTSSAQPYKKAIGIQLGSVLGVNYKTFLGTKGAIEADFSYYINHGVMATAVYQHHFRLVDNFYLYVGGGINIGADNVGKHRDTKFAIGVDPNVGFEYNFAKSPVALGIDYRPMINFTSPMHFDVASLRIRFKI